MVQEARVYAEQELNKYRKEYEEKFEAESEKVSDPYTVERQGLTHPIEKEGE